VVAQNLLSAMPVSTSVSVGATYKFNRTDEVSGVFEYGFPVTVNGDGSSTGFSERTKTEVVGVSYGHSF
jgi:long-chain fatty acid transport protein